MMTLHAKSPCCDARVHGHGSRRRQCTKCKSTWIIRKKKRGRKQKRIAKVLLERVLIDKYTTTQESKRLSISTSAVAKRYTMAMHKIADSPYLLKLPKGPYALVADGAYFKFERRDWVLYIMALKPTNSNKAYFLDPILVKGKEKYGVWNKVIGDIPEHVKKDITALVTDGLRGAQQLAERNRWVHQRCHFHLLASLVRGKGKTKYRTRNSVLREQILSATRVLLTSTNKRRLPPVRKALRKFMSNPVCPAYIRKHADEFLERENDFRAYLNHLELNLPKTTNAVESTVHMVRGATRTARTPKSLLLRAVVFMRLKRFVVCNGEEIPHN